MQKRVLAIHDISCVGRCSLTVALPILSAAGFETSILPTAVLSTHTGGFTGYTFRDLTCDIMPIAEHWRSLNLHFDAIYTGYLGSFEQIELVSKIIDIFKSDNTVVLSDPVMADNGVMYAGFKPEFAKGMVSLCAKGDIIIPNMTEASFLLGRDYVDLGHSKPDIEELLRALTALGPKAAVLTGVTLDESKMGAAAYDSETGEYFWYLNDRVNGFFHGTGDVFASAFLAAYMNNKGLQSSIETAVRFTLESILRTKAEGTENRYGVDFENSLPSLIKEIKG